MAAALTACLLVGVCAASPLRAQETIVVELGSPMSYLANSADPGIGLGWVTAGFDAAAWATGTYGVGYGAGPLVQTPVAAGTRSIYTRVSFDVADVTLINNVFLGAEWDDGYMAWLNGVEIYRSPQMPVGDPVWNTPAGDHESSNDIPPNYGIQNDISSIALPLIQNGTNVLAVGVWNIGPASSDLVIAPQLTLNKETRLDRGPYLHQATPDGITIRWRTSVPLVSRVEFGTQQGNLTSFVEGLEPKQEHEVRLTGLGAGTTYYYSVGSPSLVLAGDDPDHFFVTAPLVGDPGPTRVWVLGDSGTGNVNAAAVRNAYYAMAGTTHTDLWLMLGDNAYPQGTDSEYQARLFDFYPEMLRKSPLYPAFGNHDVASADSPTQSGVYYDIFTLPSAGEAGGTSSGTEAYYSFDHANIHFVVLDSTDTVRSVGGPMLTWLDADLANTSQDWIIAYWHHPPYSKGTHDSDLEFELIEMRENVVPILDARGVDLTLTGHSHSYERSYLMNGHYGNSTTFSNAMKVQTGDGNPQGDGPYSKPQAGATPHTGIVHTVAGSSGQITGGVFGHPAILVEFNTLGSMVLDVDGDRLDARFLDSTGVVLDHFTILKGQPPVASFATSTPLGEAPLAVGFSDLSQNGPFGWAWDFQNDGAADSSVRNPTFVFGTTGIYSINLTVTNAAGVDSMLKIDHICVHTTTPTELTGLKIEGNKTAITWEIQPDAGDYDILRGDLIPLRSTGGSWPASNPFCLSEAGRAAVVSDLEQPAVGQAFYYLARATDCANRIGSFDITGGSQAGSRDLDLAPVAEACSCPAGLDADGDGVCDTVDDCTDTDGDGAGDPGFGGTCPVDNCPTEPNPTQADGDLDGFGNICDNCPATPNSTQTDTDGDGAGDACDVCPNDPLNDADNDGFCADADNCPAIANPTQTDTDADGAGDACDVCPNDPLDDADNDGFCADVDNCPAIFNPTQTDTDADGTGDACDACPNDPLNDADNDGFCADADNCPATANPTQADQDGDGLGNECDDCTDFDGDGFGDPAQPANTCPPDNCPGNVNPGQEDADGDTLGDPCDTCTDTDGDGFGDPGFPANTCAIDNCPVTANPFQIDFDGDGIGNACDLCLGDPVNDPDGDGICDVVDNCPGMANTDQADADTDGIGDVCDPCPATPLNDADGDGFCADVDNCPAIANPTQVDTDGDGAGDACDVCPNDPLDDADGDGFCADVDNCPAIANPTQADTDADGAGDACDVCPNDPLDDADGDGFCADADNCPATANPTQADQDGDGLGNECDSCTDFDGDGFGDPGFPANTCTIDNCPTIFNPAQTDTDGDGTGNACECLLPISDDFSVAGTPPPGWTEFNGIWSASGGELFPSGGRALAYSVDELCNLDHWIHVEITTVEAQIGVAFRLNGGSITEQHYIVVYDDIDRLFLWGSCVGAGANCNLVDDSGQDSFTMVAGDSLGAQVKGTGVNTEVNVWKNPLGSDPRLWGAPQWTSTTDPGAGAADSGNNVGLFARRGEGNFDNFKANSTTP